MIEIECRIQVFIRLEAVHLRGDHLVQLVNIYKIDGSLFELLQYLIQLHPWQGDLKACGLFLSDHLFYQLLKTLKQTGLIKRHLFAVEGNVILIEMTRIWLVGKAGKYLFIDLFHNLVASDGLCVNGIPMCAHQQHLWLHIIGNATTFSAILILISFLSIC